MIGWLLKRIPNDYKWSVVTKKIGYTIGKMAAGLLAYGQAQAALQQLGINVDPETFKNGVALVAIGAMEALHDYLKLKFPNASWL